MWNDVHYDELVYILILKVNKAGEYSIETAAKRTRHFGVEMLHALGVGKDEGKKMTVLQSQSLPCKLVFDNVTHDIQSLLKNQ